VLEPDGPFNFIPHTQSRAIVATASGFADERRPVALAARSAAELANSERKELIGHPLEFAVALCIGASQQRRDVGAVLALSRMGVSKRDTRLTITSHFDNCIDQAFIRVIPSLSSNLNLGFRHSHDDGLAVVLDMTLEQPSF
jgi:hypothetical protein